MNYKQNYFQPLNKLFNTCQNKYLFNSNLVDLLLDFMFGYCKANCTVRQTVSTVRQTVSTVRQTVCTVSQTVSTVRQTVCTVSQTVCTVSQTVSTVNQIDEILNRIWIRLFIGIESQTDFYFLYNVFKLFEGQTERRI